MAMCEHALAVPHRVIVNKLIPESSVEVVCSLVAAIVRFTHEFLYETAMRFTGGIIAKVEKVHEIDSSSDVTANVASSMKSLAHHV